MQHFPTAGEIVIFDRRWYNHAGVEQVMGFSSKEEHEPFLRVCPEVQKFVVDSGIQLIKFGLEAGNEEQKPAKHDANAPASRNARVAKLALTFLGLPRSPWCRYSPFLNCGKAIVTPKLTLHWDAIGEFWR